MRIGLLGPLVVLGDDGRTVDVSGARLRRLLIRLALDTGQLVTADALIDAVWGETRSAGAANALQTLVFRLRRTLPEPARLGGRSGAYRLDVAPEQLDSVEFERLAAAGSEAVASGEPAVAAKLLDEALALWRGPAFADVADADFVQAPAARLTDLRLTAVEDRIEADLQRGGGAGLVARCTELTAAHPLRERPYGLLMRALRDAGRPGEALRAYQDLRRTLAEELGVDPSAELAALHTTILRAENGPRGNLRAPLTSFVGRDADVARLTGLLQQSRLVTLVGPGGVGKTRLATETARANAGRAPDGGWLVELAPVRRPEEVPRALAEALRLRVPSGPGGGDLLGRLLEALADKRLLIVLDNCEHLVSECARIADALLGGCPELRILATSREPLAITGETLCPVAPLSTPPGAVDTAGALTFPAVRLFADRAAAVQPAFAVTPATVPDVVRICRRLDGLPLAIELATARLRTLPVDQVAARLGDRFRLLTGGSRVALPRHRTLRAVVEWSWGLLGPDEQRLARWFSVFLDGATLDTVEAVCAGASAGAVRAGTPAAPDTPVAPDDQAVLEALGGLVDKSLVTFADGRYRMLETIRDYATERLDEAGEADRARTAHAAHFLRLAETADPALRGPDQVRWLARLSADRENLGAALRWAVDSADAPTAVRLAAALCRFWSLRSAHDEAATWLARCLAVPGTTPARPRAVALAYHALFRIGPGDLAGNRAALAEAEALDGLADPFVALAGPLSAVYAGDDELAWSRLPAVLAHPDPWASTAGLALRGSLRTKLGDSAAGERDYAAALTGFRAIGDRWGIGIAVAGLAESSALRGDHAAAIGHLEEALRLATELGARDDTTQMSFRLGLLRCRAGDLAGARADLDRAAREARLAGFPARQVLLSLGTAELARRSGDLITAEQAYRGAVEALAATGQVVRAELRAPALLGLALTATSRGNPTAARGYVRELLSAVTSGRNRPGLADAGVALAGIVLAEGDPAGTAYLLGLAEAIRGVPAVGDPDVAATAESARTVLGQEYRAAHAAGAREPLERAITVLTERIGADPPF
ncbi:winged helix-turn-helix domain-containing protein [Plantactinospora sp. S1510]|uniref:Winged helix-turn-helix domain-containing protein n=1 Tax=Plantactinospora alkalitolerans TaxID=2789879 RepID=A0ABS0GP38_9ACTN|nr:BTAD domain-containing putative transcriptional regulator [Plantactinospora alkalitolerans]MBF9127952.1 winged helix-turn-helix domain-containing protein [Plantactinospora alkalitolerans]